MDDVSDDLFGLGEAIYSKATPAAIGSWVAMANKTEGRDKFLKLVQFAARFLKWHKTRMDDGVGAAVWGNLQSSLMESRKSVTVLKGINKVDQLFDELPKAGSTFEKVCTFGNLIGVRSTMRHNYSRELQAQFQVALFWHWDYLAHANRAKIVRFDDVTAARVSRLPGKCRK